MTNTSLALNVPMEDQKICGIYQLKQLITETLHTQVWTVCDDAEQYYAAKLTTLTSNGSSRSSYVDELDVFRTLTRGQIIPDRSLDIVTPPGFPSLFFFGRHLSKYDVIVTQLLPAAICNLRTHIMWRPFATTAGYLQLFDNMISSIMILHQHGFIHRNVKPHNFRINRSFIPLLMNFTVAKRYIDLATGCHIPLGRERNLFGSIKYASINSQRLLTQSRRDDLMSLGYSIIDVMKGTLPWDRVTRARFLPETARLVLQKKENTSLTTLCYGLPNGILRYMRSVSSLSYYSAPDYNRLRTLVSPVRQ